MKTYLMTIVILLILVHKTSGSMKNLPRRQTMEKEQKCENNQGFCRKKCQDQEVELRYCLSGKMCCISTYSTLITYLEKETIHIRHLGTTLSEHVY
ncbi:unnamed protein product [Rangifer tarandus platyrhynchus]|uniref:Uncharacterized protein n=3 Tax=Rangifer tarandus platyrhynchus TaxID=3082113 RepID=A0AC59Y9J7_RANTA|nr:unnamed protein product [Rangifer tarandus platyrhynchus]CAI9712981.1 unnamed protein product [Rangifer tarandus platyrhynchus]